jgi:hypothetical protein
VDPTPIQPQAKPQRMELTAELLQVQREVLQESGLEKLLTQTDEERMAEKAARRRRELLALHRAQKVKKTRRGYRPYQGEDSTMDLTLNQTSDATLERTGLRKMIPLPCTDSLLRPNTDHDQNPDQSIDRLQPIAPQGAPTGLPTGPEGGFGPKMAMKNKTPPGQQQQQRLRQQQQHQRPHDNDQDNAHDRAHDNVQE